MVTVQVPHPRQRLKITLLEFRNRFTQEEKRAMYSSDDIDVKIYLDDLSASEFIYLNSAHTIEIVNHMETLGLINTGRATKILAL